MIVLKKSRSEKLNRGRRARIRASHISSKQMEQDSRTMIKKVVGFGVEVIKIGCDTFGVIVSLIM